MEKSVKNNKSVKVAHNIWATDKEGFTYTQRITIHLTKVELLSFNTYVLDKVLSNDRPNYNEKLYLKRLSYGDNYTNNTTRRNFVEYFHLTDNKRIKTDRNTIIRVI